MRLRETRREPSAGRSEERVAEAQWRAPRLTAGIQEALHLQ